MQKTAVLKSPINPYSTRIGWKHIVVHVKKKKRWGGDKKRKDLRATWLGNCCKVFLYYLFPDNKHGNFKTVLKIICQVSCLCSQERIMVAPFSSFFKIPLCIWNVLSCHLRKLSEINSSKKKKKRDYIIKSHFFSFAGLVGIICLSFEGLFLVFPPPLL